MIENNKFSCKIPVKQSRISDRDAALRRVPNSIPWNSKMVEELITAKVEDISIRRLVIAKLKACPDGALGKFVDNLENKIAQAIVDNRPKNEVIENLTQSKTTVSIEDLLDIKKSMQLNNVEEPPHESEFEHQGWWWLFYSKTRH